MKVRAAQEVKLIRWFSSVLVFKTKATMIPHYHVWKHVVFIKRPLVAIHEDTVNREIQPSSPEQLIAPLSDRNQNKI